MRGLDRIFVQSAENLAYQNDLYALPNSDPSWLGPHIDNWGYEKSLPDALDQLADRAIPLSATTWLHTLVPFVVGMLIRGPDANNGVNNEGRIIEFQELLAPVMAARWTVLHYPQTRTLLVSDRSWGFVDSPVGEGIAMPIDQSTALLLTYGERRRIATASGSGWVTPIGHIDVGLNAAERVCDSVSRHARDAIYGPSEALVSEFSTRIGAAGSPLSPATVTDANCDLLCHVYDYFRACTAISELSVERFGTITEIAWDALSIDWSTPVAAVVLFPERTRGGIYLTPSALMIDLSFGMAVRTVRTTLRDFNRGAYAVFPVSHLSDRAISLSNSARYTEMNTPGQTTLVDLGLLRQDLGYP